MPHGGTRNSQIMKKFKILNSTKKSYKTEEQCRKNKKRKRIKIVFNTSSGWEVCFGALMGDGNQTGTVHDSSCWRGQSESGMQKFFSRIFEIV